MRITLFGKKPPKKDAAASSVGLSCSKYGSSGATLFMANVMDIFCAVHAAVFLLAAKVSPYIRGRHRPRPRRKNKRRFIPAYTGQSDLSGRSWGVSGIHPRVCGADQLLPDASSYPIDSSPYIWGRHSLHKVDGFLHRLIPVRTRQTE